MLNKQAHVSQGKFFNEILQQEILKQFESASLYNREYDNLYAKYCEQHLHQQQQGDDENPRDKFFSELQQKSEKSFFNLPPKYQQILQQDCLSHLVFKLSYSPPSPNFIDRFQQLSDSKTQLSFKSVDSVALIQRWAISQANLFNQIQSKLFREYFTCQSPQLRKQLTISIDAYGQASIDFYLLSVKLKQEQFSGSQYEFEKNLPQLSVTASKQLILKQISFPRLENLKYLSESRLEEFINHQANRRIACKKIKKIRMANQAMLPKIRFTIIKSFNPSESKDNKATRPDLHPHLIPANMEIMVDKLAEFAKIHHIREDIKLDNGALLLYAVDQYFHKVINSQNGYFLHYVPYHYSHAMGEDQNSQLQQHVAKELGNIIKQDREFSMKVRLRQGCTWIERIERLPERDDAESLLNSQDVILQHHRDALIRNWMKILLLEDIIFIERSIEQHAFTLTSNVPNMLGSKIYEEFLSKYLKLYYVSCRKSTIRLLNYLNYFRVVQKNINIHYIQSTESQLVVTQYNKSLTAKKLFAPVHNFKEIFQINHSDDHFKLTSPVLPRHGVLGTYCETNELNSSLIHLEENELKEILQDTGETNPNLFFFQERFEWVTEEGRGLSSEINKDTSNRGDFLDIYDHNSYRIIYDAVYHDFFDISEQIEQIAAFLLHSFDSSKTLEDLQQCYSNSQHTVVEKFDRQAIVSDILQAEADFYQQKVLLVMKIQDILDNLFDKQLRVKLIDIINQIMSARPRIDIFEGTRTLACYATETALLKLQNEILEEVVHHQKQAEEQLFTFKKQVDLEWSSEQQQPQQLSDNFARLRAGKIAGASVYYYQKCVAKLWLEIRNNLRNITQEYGYTQGPFHVFDVQQQYLSMLLQEIRLLLYQDFELAKDYGDFKWIELDSVVDGVDPFRGILRRLSVFSNDGDLVKDLEDDEREDVLEVRRILDTVDLVETLVKQSEMKFNAMQVPAYLRFKDRIVNEIFRLTLAMDVYREQLAYIGEDFVQVLEQIIAEENEVRISAANYTRMLLDFHSSKYSKDMQLLEHWEMTIIKPELIEYLVDLFRVIRLWRFYVESAVLLNNASFEELQQRWHREEGFVLSPEGEVLSFGNGNDNVNGNNSKQLSQTPIAYERFLIEKGVESFVDIFEVKKFISTMVARQSRLANMLNKGFKAKTNMEELQKEQRLKKLKKVDKQKVLRIQQAVKRLAKEVANDRAQRLEQQGDSMIFKNLKEFLLHFKKNGLPEFARRLHQYLGFNFQKIETIMLVQRLEAVAGKLPFEEKLFTFPGENIVMQTVQKTLQRGSTIEITKKNMIRYELVKLRTAKASQPRRSKLSVVEVNFPQPRKEAVARREQYQETFTGFFDLIGYSTKIFDLPSVMQIRGMEHQDFDSYQQMPVRFGENVLKYICKKPQTSENYLNTKWIQQMEERHQKQKCLIMRNNYVTDPDHGYRQRIMFEYSQHNCFRKMPLFYMQKCLYYILNVVHLQLFLCTFDAKSMDLFLFLQGKVAFSQFQKKQIGDRQEYTQLAFKQPQIRMIRSLESFKLMHNRICKKLQFFKLNIELYNDTNEAIMVYLEKLQARLFLSVVVLLIEQLNNNRRIENYQFVRQIRDILKKLVFQNLDKVVYDQKKLKLLKQTGVDHQQQSIYPKKGDNKSNNLQIDEEEQPIKAKAGTQGEEQLSQLARLLQDEDYLNKSDLMNIIETLFLTSQQDLDSLFSLNRSVQIQNYVHQNVFQLINVLEFGLLDVSAAKRTKLSSLNTEIIDKVERILVNRQILEDLDPVMYERQYIKLLKYELRLLIVKETILVYQFNNLPFEILPEKLIKSQMDPIDSLLAQILKLQKKEYEEKKSKIIEINDVHLTQRLAFLLRYLYDLMVAEGRYFYEGSPQYIAALPFCKKQFTMPSSASIGEISSQISLQQKTKGTNTPTIVLGLQKTQHSIEPDCIPEGSNHQLRTSIEASQLPQVKFNSQYIEQLNEFIEFLRTRSEVVLSIDRQEVVLITFDDFISGLQQMYSTFSQSLAERLQQKSLCITEEVREKEEQLAKVGQDLQFYQTINKDFSLATDCIIRSQPTQQISQLICQLDFLRMYIEFIKKDEELRTKRTVESTRQQFQQLVEDNQNTLKEMLEEYKAFKQKENEKMAIFVQETKQKRMQDLKEYIISIFSQFGDKIDTLALHKIVSDYYKQKAESETFSVDPKTVPLKGGIVNQPNQQVQPTVSATIQDACQVKTNAGARKSVLDTNINEDQIRYSLSEFVQMIEKKNKKILNQLERFKHLRILQNTKEKLLREKYDKRIAKITEMNLGNEVLEKKLSDYQLQLDKLRHDLVESRKLVKRLDYQNDLLKNDAYGTSINRYQLAEQTKANKKDINDIKEKIDLTQRSISPKTNNNNKKRPLPLPSQSQKPLRTSQTESSFQNKSFYSRPGTTLQLQQQPYNLAQRPMSTTNFFKNEQLHSIITPPHPEQSASNMQKESSSVELQLNRSLKNFLKLEEIAQFNYNNQRLYNLTSQNPQQTMNNSLKSLAMEDLAEVDRGKKIFNVKLQRKLVNQKVQDYKRGSLSKINQKSDPSVTIKNFLNLKISQNEQ